MNNQDEKCAERLRTMSNREIYEYLTEQVQVIGWVPQPWEVVGSPYIIKRFSGWRNVLCRAGIYRRPTGPKNQTESRRYRREWRRQCELFEAEQRAKKEKKQRRQKAAAPAPQPAGGTSARRTRDPEKDKKAKIR